MTTVAGSPIDRLLTLFLLVAPVVSLAADTTYAVRGWDDPAAGVLHVLGAIAYGVLLLRLVTWLPAGSAGGAWLLLVGTIGTAGNVAYGFNTIHVSLGDTDLVDASGAAVLIKPLGLFFPLLLVLAAALLARASVAPGWACVLLGLSGLVWPVAHIANVAALAVAVNVALVVVGAALFARRGAGPAPVSQGQAVAVGG